MLSVWSSVLQIQRTGGNEIGSRTSDFEKRQVLCRAELQNAGGQRKTKWISLGLSEKGNKRKAEAELARLRAEFEPPKEAGDLSSDMLFADYLLEWLEIAKGRLAHATYGAYQGLLKSTIVPYFRKRS